MGWTDFLRTLQTFNSNVYRLIVVHGQLPQSMNGSVIVLIVKGILLPQPLHYSRLMLGAGYSSGVELFQVFIQDKNKRVNDNSNYPPICLLII